MNTCDVCGEETSMPYDCRLCGDSFCSSHRLPENHSCPGLSSYKSRIREEGRIFNEDLDTRTKTSTTGDLLDSLQLSSYRGNITYLLLAVMIVVFILQRAVLYLDPNAPFLHNTLFTLTPSQLQYIWTWITSIFAHGSVSHILVNGIVLFFFGTFLERKIGSERFLVFFIVSGVLAGLGHSLAVILTGGNTAIPALGASGAIAGVLGALTILNPNLKVYLWFILPMPLWVLTVAFALWDFMFAATGGVSGGGVAHVAHLSGLALGLMYGVKLKRDGVDMDDSLQLGGGMQGQRPPRRF